MRRKEKRLYFAGEATSPKFFGFMHGALDEGRKAARRILCAMKIQNDDCDIPYDDDDDGFIMDDDGQNPLSASQMTTATTRHRGTRLEQAKLHQRGRRSWAAQVSRITKINRTEESLSREGQ